MRPRGIGVEFVLRTRVQTYGLMPLARPRRSPLLPRGFIRLRPVVGRASATNRAAIYSILFKGAGGGIDWTTSHPGLLNAKVDTTRVNLKYDKVRRITSGNDAGVIKRFKMWHPMRKNLRYDEDEEGDYTESVPSLQQVTWVWAITM